jgi:hypothetical protein
VQGALRWGSQPVGPGKLAEPWFRLHQRSGSLSRGYCPACLARHSPGESEWTCSLPGRRLPDLVAAIERSHIDVELAHPLPKRVHVRKEIGTTLAKALAVAHQCLQFSLWICLTGFRTGHRFLPSDGGFRFL